jgi:hypothetical protein
VAREIAIACEDLVFGRVTAVDAGGVTLSYTLEDGTEVTVSCKQGCCARSCCWWLPRLLLLLLLLGLDRSCVCAAALTHAPTLTNQPQPTNQPTSTGHDPQG